MSRLAVLALVAACDGTSTPPPAMMPDAATGPGTFGLTWSLIDEHDQNISCDRVGARTLRIDVHERTANTSSSEVFSCDSGAGTFERSAGIYDLTFELDGTTGALATAPPQSALALAAASRVRLAPLEMTVIATGGMQLHLATGATGGNCAAKGAGGAGITATTVTLVHSGTGACEPVTFDIASGAGSYTVDCTTPVVGPCIEADQALTVNTMPSGGYQIHVRASEGATTCWSNDDAMAVPPEDQFLVRTLNLALASTPGC